MYKKLGMAVVVMILSLFGTSISAYAQVEGDAAQTTQEASQADDTSNQNEEVSLTQNTLTEDGNATLGDTVTSADDKEFITVTTKKGNTFYLIIDHQKDSDNVYFLNMVDESDLQAFLEESGTSLDSIVSLPGSEDTKTETETDAETKAIETEAADTAQDSAPKSENGSNMNYLILIIVVGVFGAAYYLKIHKKKAQATFDEYETEDEYEDDAEYEEDEVYGDDDFEDRDEDELEAELEAERHAKLEAEQQARREAERQAKLEAERVRKEKLKEEYQRLKEEEKQLDEEKEQLRDEQKRLEEKQNRIQEEQKKFEDWEDDVY